MSAAQRDPRCVVCRSARTLRTRAGRRSRLYLWAFLPLVFLAATCFFAAGCEAFVGVGSSPSLSFAASFVGAGGLTAATGGGVGGAGAGGGGSVVGIVGGVIAVALFETSFAMNFLTKKMPSSATTTTAMAMIQNFFLPPISPITSASLIRSP